MSFPAELSPHPDLAGRRLGDYLLVRRLGRGAMAEVYLAQQLSLQRPVALKLLRADLAADESYVRRFRIEAQAAAALVHANIVQIYEVGCADGLHYMAQEYVPGENLRERLRRRGTPSLPRTLDILRQVVAALTKAAERGIVHRDIKPDNILLADSGEVKVADFGLARVAAGTGVDLTQAGLTMGTPLYMSPEQVEGRPLDPRSDLYSLGVTCYHLLAGQPPFRGDTALTLAVQHLNHEPEPLETLRPDLPAELCQLVHQLLAKRPEQRPASARDVARRLAEIEARLEGRPATASGPWLTLADLPSNPRWEATSQLAAVMRDAGPARRRRWWAAYAAALVAAAVGGAALAAWTRPRPLLGRSLAAKVPRQETATRQLRHATEIGQSEEAWKAVKDYFPGTWEAEVAEQKLAMLYLDQRDWARALPLCQAFAQRFDDLDLRAFGLAGAYVALVNLNRFEEAAQYRNELDPQLQDRLQPEMMRSLFDEARAVSSRST
jgi:serine/threonine-protein kinase